MSCNCKKTVENWTGGDVPNPTTFLKCGEADGAHKSPVNVGKVQCIAESNQLIQLCTQGFWQVDGTVLNSGEVILASQINVPSIGNLKVWI